MASVLTPCGREDADGYTASLTARFAGWKLAIKVRSAARHIAAVQVERLPGLEKSLVNPAAADKAKYGSAAAELGRTSNVTARCPQALYGENRAAQ